jgi:DNA-binding response OmpR family regulator
MSTSKEARSPANPPRRILVADDEPLIRQFYVEALIRSGYQVDSTEDGEAAWEALYASSGTPDGYDLLITDNNMPRLSGVGLVNKLRSARMTLPVILVSGAAPIDTPAVEFAAVLAKPLTGDLLVRTVNQVLASADREWHAESPQAAPRSFQTASPSSFAHPEAAITLLPGIFGRV